jgi:hypothetical protein
VVLREEVQKLPKTQRDQIPDFLTTWDLVEAYYTKGEKVAQLESCMVTIAQLSHYIGYVIFKCSFLFLSTNDFADILRRTHQNCQQLQTHELLVFALVCLQELLSHPPDL